MMRSNVEISEGFEAGGEVKIIDDNSFEIVGSKVEIVVGVEESFTEGSELVIVKGETFDTSLGGKDGVGDDDKL
jgi:hypothetical protein